MSKSGKIILGLIGVAVLCSACNEENKGKAANTSMPSDDAKVAGVATVIHTKWAEQSYNLPSWEWTKADICTYDNGWQMVEFYVQGHDEPIERNWFPTK